jgi:hypothetical protein
MYLLDEDEHILPMGFVLVRRGSGGLWANFLEDHRKGKGFLLAASRRNNRI